MIRCVLALFDLLAPLIRLMGADYGPFRAILETKLILDGRRRSPAAPPVEAKARPGRPAKADRKPANMFARSLVVYAVMGLMLLPFVRGAAPLVGMTVVNAYLMVMIAMALVADFSSVLLDTSDNAILQPRPVDGRTVLLARGAHVATYLTLLTLSLSLVVLIAGSFTIHPLFAPVFAATLCCSIALVVSATHVLYALAMRLTTPERLRDIITYMQIGFSVLVVGGYQLLPRLVDFGELRRADISDRSWIYWFPPAWLAGPIDLLTGHAGRAQVTLSCLAVIVPAASLLFVLKVVGPRFNRLLLAAETDAPGALGRRETVQREPRRTAGDALAAWVTRSPAERGAFELIWRLCGRDRPFKMRTYPALFFPFIFSLGFLLAGRGDAMEALRDLPGTQKHLFLLYMASAMIPNVLMQLRFSEKHEAAWVYFSLPIGDPGEVLFGTLKAVMLRFIVPGFALISLPVAAFWGLRSLPDVGVAFCALLFISAMEALLYARALPFSTAFGALEMSGRFVRSMLLMGVPAAIGGVHYGLSMLAPVGLVPLAGLLLGGAWLAARNYRRTSWPALRAAGT
ncbi:MAG: hypothetical protein HRF43_07735 [Phycisphaerae bacterium]|jgi:hypothetical protein